MALRVARGLFRLWLVLSVLWIGGVGAVTWRDFPDEPWGLNDPIVEEAPSKPRSDEFNPNEYLASKFAEDRRSAIRHASLLAFVPPSLLAFVPPAFVLALGSALVWAFRGFRWTMIEAIKLVGSIIGLLTGIAYFYDRMAKGRPIASLSIAKHGSQKIACIRISNVSNYDVAIIDATVAPPSVYFLTEDLETKNLLEGAAGQRPYFMLKPREEKTLVIAPLFKDGKEIADTADIGVKFRISWRSGNATWLPQVPVRVSTSTSMVRKYATQREG
jgi:hypothetical protein